MWDLLDCCGQSCCTVGDVNYPHVFLLKTATLNPLTWMEALLSSVALTSIYRTALKEAGARALLWTSKQPKRSIPFLQRAAKMPGHEAQGCSHLVLRTVADSRVVPLATKHLGMPLPHPGSPGAGQRKAKAPQRQWGCQEDVHLCDCCVVKGRSGKRCHSG